MGVRAANRIYKRSELALWLRRVDCDWESLFRTEELLYGRKLYKLGAIRTLELNHSEAIICAKLDDDSEPFCVMDFDGDDYVDVSHSNEDFLNGALRVAGFYEIQELVADVFSSADFLDYDERETLEFAKKSTIEEEPSADFQEAVESVEEKNEEIYPKLLLTFSSKRKGLSFSVSWLFEDGTRRRAFGEKAFPLSDLGDFQKENLVRLATMSRKAGFKYDANVYNLAEISKIPSFLRYQLPIWSNYFDIVKDDYVDLLSLGEREVSLKPVVKSLDSNTADFDVVWSPVVDGKAIDATEFPKILSGGISTLKIVPEYGILRVSSSETAFAKSVERAREFGFENGKIPRYMLLSLSDFGGGLTLSDDLRKWAQSLTSTSFSGEDSLPSFLRNYQKRGVLWARKLFDHDCNALIADEMGLGKTLQTLSLIDMLYRENPNAKFFVVCPASVIPVWISETSKFFPHLRASTFSSNTDFSKSDIWISSYTQLRRNRALAETVKFEMAVLDEAQFIKNPDAKTTLACMSLKANKKIALTGTPVENRLLDMWTTFRWLMPGLMGQRVAFESALKSDDNFVKNTRRQIAPFVLRRLKSEVATELPEKVYMDLTCPMSEQQKSEYQKLLSEAKNALSGVGDNDAKARFTVLSLLTRLRQTACDAALLPWVGKEGTSECGGKISVLLDKLEELYLSGKKILIFSQYTRFLQLIMESIEVRFPQAPVFSLTGATRDRVKPVDSFQRATGGAIMLISLRAGGTGITLTSADYVFLADPWWNPAVEEQAIDRVHRIGRKGEVFVYRMIAGGTVEERVRDLQSQKRRLFNDLLGGLKDVSNHSKFMETVSDILS